MNSMSLTMRILQRVITLDFEERHEFLHVFFFFFFFFFCTYFHGSERALIYKEGGK